MQTGTAKPNAPIREASACISFLNSEF